MPILTIITPVYNAEKYLCRCIDSILNQTLADFELILVNDGSPDGSADICEEYAKKDSRVKVLHQENQGQAAARNHALDIATGTYIGFVDSDDYIHPRMYEILVKNAVDTGAEISIGGYRSVSLESANTEDFVEIVTSTASGDDFLRHCLLDAVDKKCWVLWDKIFRRECFDGIRMPEGRIHEDNAVVYKLLYEANKVVDCDVPLYYYYQNPESTMNRRFGIKNLDWLKVLREMVDYFTEKKDEVLLDKMNRSYLFALADLLRSVKEKLNNKKAEKALKKELKRQYNIEKEKYPITIKTHPDVWNQLFPVRAQLYWQWCNVKSKFKRG